MEGSQGGAVDAAGVKGVEGRVLNKITRCNMVSWGYNWATQRERERVCSEKKGCVQAARSSLSFEVWFSSVFMTVGVLVSA